jgi:hypothetical protein
VTSRNQQRAQQRMSWRLYSNSPTPVPDPEHSGPPGHDARNRASDFQSPPTRARHERHPPSHEEALDASLALLVPPFPTPLQEQTNCTPRERRCTQHIDLLRYRRNTADSFHHTSYNERAFRGPPHERDGRARDVRQWTIAGEHRGAGELILSAWSGRH